MATVLTISASPAAASRSAAVRRLVDARLADRGHRVQTLDVRDLPAAPLLGADTSDPAIEHALDLFRQAHGIVIVTPVYKAAYSGLFKTLCDLLPQSGLADKVVLPLATGGSTAHVLAIDYALRPVLTSLGAAQVVQGYFLLDRDITLTAQGPADLDAQTHKTLIRVLTRFTTALDLYHAQSREPATLLGAPETQPHYWSFE